MTVGIPFAIYLLQIHRVQNLYEPHQQGADLEVEVVGHEAFQQSFDILIRFSKVMVTLIQLGTETPSLKMYHYNVLEIRMIYWKIYPQMGS